MPDTTVQVLLSTYDGAAHICEQMESIVAQRDVDVSFLLRDDGSTDRTVALLQRYDGPAFQLHVGANIGAAQSFLWLLEHSSAEYDFTAFADQDDFWLPDKLSRAAAELRIYGDSPAMYCSRLIITDATLRATGMSHKIPRGPSFRNAIVQNIAAGCTIVLNRRARALLTERLPKTVYMHDWWIYQAISGVGHVVMDSESRILYRQHGANVVGSGHRGLQRLVDAWRRFAEADSRLTPPAQLAELERCYSDLWTPAQRQLARHLAEAPRQLSARLELATKGGVVFQDRWREIAFRALVGTGRF